MLIVKFQDRRRQAHKLRNQAKLDVRRDVRPQFVIVIAGTDGMCRIIMQTEGRTA